MSYQVCTFWKYESGRSKNGSLDLAYKRRFRSLLYFGQKNIDLKNVQVFFSRFQVRTRKVVLTVLSLEMTRQPLALAVTLAATELRCRGPPPPAAPYSPTRCQLQPLSFSHPSLSLSCPGLLLPSIPPESWQASSKIWLTNLANGAFEKRTYMEQFCFTCQLDLGLFTTTDVYFHQLRHHKDHLRPAAPPGALRCPLKPHYDKQGGKIRLAKFNPIFRFLSPILIIRCGCSCQPPEIPILPETGTLSLRRSKEWTQQQLV